MPWTESYLDLVRALDLDIHRDFESTQIIHRMVKGESLSRLQKIIEGRPVIIFGCGPSLENDLQKIMHEGLHKKCLLVAADGAVKALLEEKIVPKINITDLDGDIHSIIRANYYGCITIVHAHGDNLHTISKVLPYLSGTVYATTQHEPTPKVHNFGGFTDGDRACYIINHFRPKLIALAGMDFGRLVGVYSGIHDKLKKPRKLLIGKKLIEDLVTHSKTRFINMTSSGEHILGVEEMEPSKISKLI